MGSLGIPPPVGPLGNPPPINSLFSNGGGGGGGGGGGNDGGFVFTENSEFVTTTAAVNAASTSLSVATTAERAVLINEGLREAVTHCTRGAQCERILDGLGTTGTASQAARDVGTTVIRDHLASRGETQVVAQGLEAGTQMGNLATGLKVLGAGVAVVMTTTKVYHDLEDGSPRNAALSLAEGGVQYFGVGALASQCAATGASVGVLGGPIGSLVVGAISGFGCGIAGSFAVRRTVDFLKEEVK